MVADRPFVKFLSFRILLVVAALVIIVGVLGLVQSSQAQNELPTRSTTVGKPVNVGFAPSNTGSVGADFGAKIFLPPSFRFVSATPAQGTCSFDEGSNTVTCDVGFLEPGESIEIDVFAIPTEVGTFEVTAFAFTPGSQGPTGTIIVVVEEAQGPAAPAPTPVTQEIGQESESGEVSLAFEVASEGDYADQCVPGLQSGDTANLQNGQGFVQDVSAVDDLEAEGNSFGFAPASEAACDQAAQQSAAAASS